MTGKGLFLPNDLTPSRSQCTLTFPSSRGKDEPLCLGGGGLVRPRDCLVSPRPKREGESPPPPPYISMDPPYPQRSSRCHSWPACHPAPQGISDRPPGPTSPEELPGEVWQAEGRGGEEWGGRGCLRSSSRVDQAGHQGWPPGQSGKCGSRGINRVTKSFPVPSPSEKTTSMYLIADCPSDTDTQSSPPSCPLAPHGGGQL